MSNMSQEELDLWSDINNPNNDADMDDWADAHNPNNDDYLGDDQQLGVREPSLMLGSLGFSIFQMHFDDTFAIAYILEMIKLVHHHPICCFF